MIFMKKVIKTLLAFAMSIGLVVDQEYSEVYEDIFRYIL